MYPTLCGVFVLEYHEMTQKGPLTKIDTALGSRDFVASFPKSSHFIHMWNISTSLRFWQVM